MSFSTKKSQLFRPDAYLKAIQQRADRREWLNAYFFGFGFGNALIFTFLAKWLFNRTSAALDKIYLILAGSGAVIVLLTIFLPSVARYLQKAFSYLLAKIGFLLLAAILLVIYLIWFVPVGLILQQQNRRQLHYSKTTWEDIK